MNHNTNQTDKSRSIGWPDYEGPNGNPDIARSERNRTTATYIGAGAVTALLTGVLIHNGFEAAQDDAIRQQTETNVSTIQEQQINPSEIPQDATSVEMQTPPQSNN